MRPAPLDRKVLRDLWRMRWQVLAIALLIGCGVALSVMAFSAQRALVRAQRDFYAQTRFADVFAQVRRASIGVARGLAAVEGVAQVDARIVQAGLMDVPGLQRPATVRLISLPEHQGEGLNGLVLMRGRYPDPRRTDEAIALAPFMSAAHVQLGQRLTAVVAGRQFAFSVVGAALSPEYVYVPSPESFMPDDAHQAVLWAPRPAVERTAGLTGGFNVVSARLAGGASVDQAIEAFDARLAPYGGRAAYARADQPSHAFLTAELKELSISASILPPIFLIVAAGLVHQVISRLVQSEREQIGLLKAFGYSDHEASVPYLKLAAAIGLVGAVWGGVAGAWLGASIVDVYRAYFRFPALSLQFHWPAFAASATVAMGAAVLGSLMAVRRASRLSPATAMQPPRPAAYRQGPLDALVRRVDQASRMIVRTIERFPGRAALSALGMAASLSLLVGTQFLFDGLEKVIDQAYYRTQSWTHAIAFEEAKAAGALASVRRLPGVLTAEPVRSVAARLKAEGREEPVRIIGLSPSALLQRPLDVAGRPLPLAGNGVAISDALARRLGVGAGDPLWIEVLDGRAPTALVTVTGLAEDYSGFAAYMDRRALNRLMGEGDVASGAQLLVAADRAADFYRAVERVPEIIAASSRDDTVSSWRQVMSEAFRRNITFYVGFAAAIAFGVAFNTMRVALSERSRDLATLHVLGFGHWECAYIMGGELILIALAAIPVGLAGGDALAHGLVAAYSREDVRLPATVSARSVGVALLAYLLAVLAGGVLVARRIWSLDLVAVLKTRE